MSQFNTPVLESLFAGLRPAASLKRDSGTGIFLIPEKTTETKP